MTVKSTDLGSSTLRARSRIKGVLDQSGLQYLTLRDNPGLSDLAHDRPAMTASATAWRKELKRRMAAAWVSKMLATTLGISAFFVAYFWVLHNPLGTMVTMPLTALDRLVPIEPRAMPLYLSLWLYVSIGPALLRDSRELARYGLDTFVLGTTGLLIFLLWPTSTPDFGIDWELYPSMAFLKDVDASANACPSLHVAFAVFTGLAAGPPAAGNRAGLPDALPEPALVRRDRLLDDGGPAARGARCAGRGGPRCGGGDGARRRAAPAGGDGGHCRPRAEGGAGDTRVLQQEIRQLQALHLPGRSARQVGHEADHGRRLEAPERWMQKPRSSSSVQAAPARSTTHARISWP